MANEIITTLHPDHDNHIDIYPNIKGVNIPVQSIDYTKIINGTLKYITPEMFGAIGDGVTDDHSALQSALDSQLPVLLTKTYLITKQITSNNNDLLIFGNGTIIMNNTDPDEHTIVITGENITIMGIIFKTPLYENLNNQEAYNGVSISNCKNVLLENCYFIGKNTRINGLLDFYTNWYNVKISNCIFDVNTTYEGSTHIGGIWFRSRDNIICENLNIDSCTFNGVSSDEVLAIWGSNEDLIKNVIISNCIITGSGMPHLITLGGVYMATLTGNIITSNTTSYIIHATYGNAISKKVNVNGGIIRSTSTSGTSQLATRDVKFYGTRIEGITLGSNINEFYDCTIILSENKTGHYDCKYFGCFINITITSNQLFRNSVVCEHCNMVFNGNNVLQLLKNDGTAVFKDCTINNNNSAIIVGTASKFTFINNIFTGFVRTSYFNTTDVIAFNNFQVDEGTPTNVPIGWSTNILG